MDTIIDRYNKIKSLISKETQDKKANIVAVSKTFKINHIKPLIDYGHLHYGENKVQEAYEKWTDIKTQNNKILLHMIGKLQSNKAKKAIELFNYIHSLDSEKLAKILNESEIRLKKNIKYFIQVNLGDEKQKSGVDIKEVDDFYNFCLKETNLNIIGLMCIPPNDGNEDKYFDILNKKNQSLGLKDLSIGMSNDYLKAIKHNSTFIRVGTSIFGKRN